MKDQLLIIGISVAFGVGYLVGDRGNRTQLITTTNQPSNYDPARAICDDALKAERARTDTCFKNWIDSEHKITH